MTMKLLMTMHNRVARHMREGSTLHTARSADRDAIAFSILLDDQLHVHATYIAGKLARNSPVRVPGSDEDKAAPNTGGHTRKGSSAGPTGQTGSAATADGSNSKKRRNASGPCLLHDSLLPPRQASS